MADNQRIDALLEWNRLARENAENAIVSSMFEASSTAISPIESFVTWLAVGAAAIASFLIGNSDKLLPILGRPGFLWCGLLLGLSCLFGVIAKSYALRANVGRRVGAAIRKTFGAHLKAYDEDEARIRETAGSLNVSVETGIRMDRVIGAFLEPMPRPVRWLVTRGLRKNANHPQLAHLPRIKSMNRLGLFSLLQVITFLIFLVVGFASAAGQPNNSFKPNPLRSIEHGNKSLPCSPPLRRSA